MIRSVPHSSSMRSSYAYSSRARGGAPAGSDVAHQPVQALGDLSDDSPDFRDFPGSQFPGTRMLAPVKVPLNRLVGRGPPPSSPWKVRLTLLPAVMIVTGSFATQPSSRPPGRSLRQIRFPDPTQAPSMVTNSGQAHPRRRGGGGALGRQQGQQGYKGGAGHAWILSPALQSVWSSQP